MQNRIVYYLAYIFVCDSVQSGESIMVEVAAGPSDSSTHEKVGRCILNMYKLKYIFVIFFGVNIGVFVLISFPWC